MKKIIGNVAALLMLVPVVAGANNLNPVSASQPNSTNIRPGKIINVKAAPTVTDIEYCANVISVHFSEAMDEESVVSLAGDDHPLVRLPNDAPVDVHFLSAASDGTAFYFSAVIEELRPYTIVVSEATSRDGRQVKDYAEIANLGQPQGMSSIGWQNAVTACHVISEEPMEQRLSDREMTKR